MRSHLGGATALKHQRRNELTLLGSGEEADALLPFACYRQMNPFSVRRAAMLSIQTAIQATLVEVNMTVIFAHNGNPRCDLTNARLWKVQLLHGYGKINFPFNSRASFSGFESFNSSGSAASGKFW